jgi:hypothetical protein
MFPDGIDFVKNWNWTGVKMRDNALVSIGDAIGLRACIESSEACWEWGVYLIKGIVSGNCRYVSAWEYSEGYSLLRLAETISEMVVR